MYSGFNNHILFIWKDILYTHGAFPTIENNFQKCILIGLSKNIEGTTLRRENLKKGSNTTILQKETQHHLRLSKIKSQITVYSAESII